MRHAGAGGQVVFTQMNGSDFRPKSASLALASCIGATCSAAIGERWTRCSRHDCAGWLGCCRGAILGSGAARGIPRASGSQKRFRGRISARAAGEQRASTVHTFVSRQGRLGHLRRASVVFGGRLRPLSPGRPGCARAARASGKGQALVSSLGARHTRLGHLRLQTSCVTAERSGCLRAPLAGRGSIAPPLLSSVRHTAR